MTAEQRDRRRALVLFAGAALLVAVALLFGPRGATAPPGASPVASGSRGLGVADVTLPTAPPVPVTPGTGPAVAGLYDPGPIGRSAVDLAPAPVAGGPDLGEARRAAALAGAVGLAAVAVALLARRRDRPAATPSRGSALPSLP